ncbi:MAG: hypothetical protein K6G09_02290 [Treponema sp.]|nr:hypothetical protein [Treponema sp.]
MKNSLCDLNDHLFECLEGLMNEKMSAKELDREIKRAQAVNNVAKTIIQNGRTQIEAMKLREEIIKNAGKGQLPEMLLPKNTSTGKVLIEDANYGK